jgi:hypothetical protein
MFNEYVSFSCDSLSSPGASFHGNEALRKNAQEFLGAPERL